MYEKRSANEELVAELKALRDVLPRGSNWELQANQTVARNVLHSELGMHSDIQPIYNLDEATRDRLLVHARQDAAEALCQVRYVVEELHRAKSELRTFNLSVWILLAIYLFWTWSKSDFALWPWLAYLIGR